MLRWKKTFKRDSTWRYFATFPSCLKSIAKKVATRDTAEIGKKNLFLSTYFQQKFRNFYVKFLQNEPDKAEKISQQQCNYF